MMPGYANGGVIKQSDRPRDDTMPVSVGHGCAVVSRTTLAQYGPELVAKINGGCAHVFAAEDVLAAYEDAED